MKATPEDIPQRQRDVLQHIRECLVIRYTFAQAIRRFVLVTEYPERSQGSDRDLAAWEFAGACRFERRFGVQLSCRRYSETYCSSAGIGSVVVQGVHPHRTGAVGRKGLEFDFGMSFGAVAFEYETLLLHRRAARVEQLDREFVYRDCESGDVFSFYDPFPALLST